MTKILIDTNLILDDHNILYKLLKKYDKIVIPLTVLKELDKLKTKPELSYSARKAIQSINNFEKQYVDKIEFYVNDDLLSENDAKIIKSAQTTQASIATKDISMSILCRALGIETETYDVVLNNIYKPYVYFKAEEVLEKIPEFSFKEVYDIRHKEIDLTACNINTNGWFFILIEDPYKNKSIIYANNPIEGLLERIDNIPEYRSLLGDKLKALDAHQICAMYALKRAPNILITGKWGSGKSLLGTAYCIEKEDKKTFLSRAPIGINKKYDLGFMPGSKDEKMLDWVSGVTSALYYIVANTRGQKKGADYDHVKDAVFREKFDIIPINAIQGLSLLKDDILLVDEVQLLDVDTMSMILSRPGEKGKLILLGDLNQTYSTLKPSESGLLKLLRILPHPSLAYVELENSYRSNILELAELLQDKTIS